MPSPKRDPPMLGSCIKRNHPSVSSMQISLHIINNFEFKQENLHQLLSNLWFFLLMTISERNKQVNAPLNKKQA